jgi:hypothetical protein
MFLHSWLVSSLLPDGLKTLQELLAIFVKPRKRLVNDRRGLIVPAVLASPLHALAQNRNSVRQIDP